MFNISTNRRDRMMSDLQSRLQEWSPFHRRRMNQIADTIADRVAESMSVARRASNDVARAGASTMHWASKPSHMRIWMLAAGIGLLAFLAGKKS